MKIIDTYNQMKTCFEENIFQKDKWDEYITHVYPSLKETICEDVKYYNMEEDILPVLNQVPRSSRQLLEMHLSFDKIIEDLDENIKAEFHTSLDTTIILYLGLCNGAGWVTEINGQTVILLGIEKIIELNWIDEKSMIGLIYHELGHVWHLQERMRTIKNNIIKDTKREQSLWNLYSEGVAMYFEQRLCGKENFYHQDHDGWLTWCQENRTRLFREYTRRIKNDESTQIFFGDWCCYEDHSDVGYYLGNELIKEALKSYSCKQVLNLHMEEVEQLLIICVQDRRDY